MQLGSGIAVAVAQAGSCSSDLTPILGTSICITYNPKKKKKKKKKSKIKQNYYPYETCNLDSDKYIKRGKNSVLQEYRELISNQAGEFKNFQ